ncbi:MAG: polysaccharide deacetylase family protein [Syntrophobacter sp.]
MSGFRRFCLIVLLPCLLPLSISTMGAGAEFDTYIQSPLPAIEKGSIRAVRMADSRKLLALTFDLCEGPRETSGYASEIIDFLKANSVKATFFAGGKWMRSHPEQSMQLMAEPLFEIGNHSWSHANFRRITLDEAREQVLGTQEEYTRLRKILVERLQEKGIDAATAGIRRSMDLFRFPYGTCTGESLEMISELGLRAIQWDVVSGDPAKGRTAAGIVNTVMRMAKPGSIVIFHANGKGNGTLASLRELVPELRKRGFEFAGVSELLAAGTPISAPDCYELTPGDNLRYDRPVSRTRK